MAADFRAMTEAAMGKTTEQRVAARLDTTGGRGRVRPPGGPDDRGADRPLRPRRAAHAPTIRRAAGARSRATTSCASRSRRARPVTRCSRAGSVSLHGDEVLEPGPDQGGLDRRPAAVDPDQPPGGALHGAGRARRVHPGGPRRPKGRRRCDGDIQARPRRAAGDAKRQRRDHEAACGVVDVEDPATGTVRLRNQITDVDEMALDTRSTRTVRVGPGA